MIKYSLVCKDCDLIFESWFASSKEYEKLKKKNFLNCHICNSNNVEKSFADNDISSKADALAYANGALIFGCFCFVLDFSGIFFGNSLFMPSMNLFHVIFHATGSILLSWLITNNWYVSALWPIILCTNLPTALMELSIIIGIYGLKVISR